MLCIFNLYSLLAYLYLQQNFYPVNKKNKTLFISLKVVVEKVVVAVEKAVVAVVVVMEEKEVVQETLVELLQPQTLVLRLVRLCLISFAP